MSILIKNVLLKDKSCDVYIEKNRFSKIARDLPLSADIVIDGSNFAILPAFYNTHTHAAMSLMRSYADDIELFSWLNDYIWPLENKITEEDVYQGARLAALEMIKSGTVFFNDMYWHALGTARAVKEMGLRADISLVLIDAGDPGRSAEQLKKANEVFKHEKEFPERIRFTYGPHAIYTVSEKTLRECSNLAKKENRRIQIHLSETASEVADSLRNFGKRPVEYLDSMGFLGPHVTAVHCVHLTENDRAILKRRGVSLAHCPASNMKLSSGAFDYPALKKAGIPVMIATDGASSNNNLSMLESMKFAALWAKSLSGDPRTLPAEEAFAMATRYPAEAMGLDAGRIEEGALADCLLINLRHPTLLPSGNLITNMVYSANPECIDTVICDGNILMQKRIVPAEEAIIEEAEAAFQRLLSR